MTQSQIKKMFGIGDKYKYTEERLFCPNHSWRNDASGGGFICAPCQPTWCTGTTAFTTWPPCQTPAALDTLDHIHRKLEYSTHLSQLIFGAPGVFGAPAGLPCNCLTLTMASCWLYAKWREVKRGHGGEPQKGKNYGLVDTSSVTQWPTFVEGTPSHWQLILQGTAWELLIWYEPCCFVWGFKWGWGDAALSGRCCSFS